MEEIVKAVLASMSSVNRPQAKFMLIFLMALVSFRGKATFRNLSRYSSLCEKTYSRWYRRTFQFDEFNEIAMKRYLPESRHLIGIVDASFIPKSGKCTEGLGWFYNGKISDTERGLELSLIAVGDVELNTAYGLSAKQTNDDDLFSSSTADSEDERTRVDLYVEQVEAMKNRLSALGIRYITADAAYSKVKFVGGVLSAGFHLVGKLRHDANLQWLFSGLQKGRGRPRKYAGKVNFENDLGKMGFDGETADGFQLYSARLYSVCFKRIIKVVYLRKQIGCKLITAVLYCTDNQLCSQLIKRYYNLRFQIEFLFRDAKQHTGLVDCQSLRGDAIDTHFNASITALNCLKLEHQKTVASAEPSVISITTMVRTKFNQGFMKAIFRKLDLSPTCEKMASIYEELSDYGAIAA